MKFSLKEKYIPHRSIARLAIIHKPWIITLNILLCYSQFIGLVLLNMIKTSAQC